MGAFIKKVCRSAHMRLPGGIPTSLSDDHIAELLKHLGVKEGAKTTFVARELLDRLARLILLLVQTATTKSSGMIPASTKLETNISQTGMTTTTACCAYLHARANGDSHNAAVRYVLNELAKEDACRKDTMSAPRQSISFFLNAAKVLKTEQERVLCSLAHAIALGKEHEDHERLSKAALQSIYEETKAKYGASNVDEMKTERKVHVAKLPKKETSKKAKKAKTATSKTPKTPKTDAQKASEASKTFVARIMASIRAGRATEAQSVLAAHATSIVKITTAVDAAVADAAAADAAVADAAVADAAAADAKPAETRKRKRGEQNDSGSGSDDSGSGSDDSGSGSGSGSDDSDSD